MYYVSVPKTQADRAAGPSAEARNQDISAQVTRQTVIVSENPWMTVCLRE